MAVGIASIPIGLVTGIVGAVRYQRMNRSITLVRRQSKEINKTGTII